MNARSLIAIARLTVSSSLQSGVARWTLGLVGLVSMGLPFVLRGGGDAFSRMHLVILYPMVISFALMVCGALWQACAAIALEISGRQLRLVAVKPVSPATIWLGKWLGLLLICFVWLLVMVAGMLISVSLVRQSYEGEDRAIIESRLLTAREVLRPQPIADLRERAEYERARLIRQGLITPDTSLTRICGEIKIAAYMASPGKRVTWHFLIEPPGAARLAGSSTALRFLFSCNPMERRPISGRWRLSPWGAISPEDSRWQLTDGAAIGTVSNLVDGVHTIDLPTGFIAATRRLQVTFENGFAVGADDLNGAKTPRVPTVYFDQNTPVELLVRRGGFVGNLLRASLALFCFLAGISAVGLAMGTMFSFPVAGFSAGAIIFALVLAGSFSEQPVEHAHGGIAAEPGIVHLTEPLLLSIKHATAGITGNLPFGALSDGIYYSRGQVAECALLLLLGLPLIFWLVSALILARKELAL